MSDFSKNEFFQKLPEEVKEKLKNCTSEEEAMEILKSNMIEVPDEILDDVAGGNIYNGKCDFKDCKNYSWRGDSREDVSPAQAAKDFEEGRITGADFFS